MTLAHGALQPVPICRASERSTEQEEKNVMSSVILRRLRQHVVSILRPDYAVYHHVVLPPPGLRKCEPAFRDDGYFLQSAQREADRVIQRCGVTGHSRILEVGCGPGRFPIGLLTRVGELAQYWGLDVQVRSIQWCQRHLTRAHPTVQFRHLNVHNLRYHSRGNPLDASFRFPFRDGSFDLIYLYSVFSHMISADIRVYLHDFHRLLGRTGWVCCTGFLEEGVPEMMSNPPGYRPRYRGPLHRVRYNQAFFEAMLHEEGFAVQRFEYATELDGQSVVYAVRQEVPAVQTGPTHAPIRRLPEVLSP
jgi:ubiquinone/menaquinone biosynthesis C-methylase UbiE